MVALSSLGGLKKLYEFFFKVDKDNCSCIRDEDNCCIVQNPYTQLPQSDDASETNNSSDDIDQQGVSLLGQHWSKWGICMKFEARKLPAHLLILSALRIEMVKFIVNLISGNLID